MHACRHFAASAVESVTFSFSLLRDTWIRGSDVNAFGYVGSVCTLVLWEAFSKFRLAAVTPPPPAPHPDLRPERDPCGCAVRQCGACPAGVRPSAARWGASGRGLGRQLLPDSDPDQRDRARCRAGCTGGGGVEGVRTAVGWTAQRSWQQCPIGLLGRDLRRHMVRLKWAGRVNQAAVCATHSSLPRSPSLASVFIDNDAHPRSRTRGMYDTWISGSDVNSFLLLWLSVPSGFLVVFGKPN
jgi:hypothetical protein